MATKLDELLDQLDDSVRIELANKPEVVDVGHDLDVSKLAIEARRWHRLTEGYAVVVDLKSSTQLGVSKHAASTASIYEAATGNAVRVLGDFGADFIAIQGDGAFGLFWGELRFERAIAAGITVKTFSERHLLPRLTQKWPELPDTGFKVGVAASPLLVKRVGIPRSSHQEPIWAGKAVNHATKAAQHADRHQLVVTGGVWDMVAKNDYLSLSCPCGGSVSELWKDVDIERLPVDDPDRPGRMLASTWCVECGPAFCEAVLSGERRRPDLAEKVKAMNLAQMSNAVRGRATKLREERRNLRSARGLR